MYATDFLIALMQYGFAIALLFFTITNLKDVADGIFGQPIDIKYIGKTSPLLTNHFCRSICIHSHSTSVFSEKN